MPNTKQHKMIMAIHHFTPIRRFGFPDGLKCWCQAELTFKPREKDIQQKRLDFFKVHEECQVVLPGRGKEQSA